MSRQIFVYDTTLRDGTQREGISLSCDDKLRIAQKLDDLGVAYIEGGWPGSNHRDVRFFELAQVETWTNARITAFGATRKPNIKPEDDLNLNALVDSRTPAVAIFGKTWSLHVEQVMANTRPENLAMIGDSVAWLKSNEREVIYDAEHFFDGFKDDAGYASQTLLWMMNSGTPSSSISRHFNFNRSPATSGPLTFFPSESLEKNVTIFHVGNFASSISYLKPYLFNLLY